MEKTHVALVAGQDIEAFRLEQLQEAIQMLSENKMYADDLLNAINGAEQQEIGASLFMWICRYLELKIEA